MFLICFCFLEINLILWEFFLKSSLNLNLNLFGFLFVFIPYVFLCRGYKINPCRYNTNERYDEYYRMNEYRVLPGGAVFISAIAKRLKIYASVSFEIWSVPVLYQFNVCAPMYSSKKIPKKKKSTKYYNLMYGINIYCLLFLSSFKMWSNFGRIQSACLFFIVCAVLMKASIITKLWCNVYIIRFKYYRKKNSKNIVQ